MSSKQWLWTLTVVAAAGCMEDGAAIPPPVVTPIVEEGCEVGKQRACGDVAGRGACRMGVQTCMASALNGEFFSTAWGPCEGAVLPKGEDCVAVCPAGQTASYHSVIDGTHYSSGIVQGPGGAAYRLSCDPQQLCPAGKVAVYGSSAAAYATKDTVDGTTRDTLGSGTSVATGMPRCVDPPPDCASMTYPEINDGGEWKCIPGCDYIVQYGGLFGYASVCAPPPNVVCPAGQSPTFVAETHVWECITTCNNGLYDQVYLDGQLICVPC